MTTPATTELIGKRRHFWVRWVFFIVGAGLRFTIGMFGTSIVIVMTQLILAILFIAVALVMEMAHQGSSPTWVKSPFLILVVASMLLSAIAEGD